MDLKNFDVKKAIGDLENVKIAQKLSYDTAVSGMDKNKRLNGEFSFSFSLLKGILAVLGCAVALGLAITAFKISVEKRFLKKLKKKYHVIPKDECTEDGPASQD